MELLPGVNIDAQTGVVSGVPTTAGRYAFTVGVKDAGGATAGAPFD